MTERWSNAGDGGSAAALSGRPPRRPHMHTGTSGRLAWALIRTMHACVLHWRTMTGTSTCTTGAPRGSAHLVRAGSLKRLLIGSVIDRMLAIASALRYVEITEFEPGMKPTESQ